MSQSLREDFLSAFFQIRKSMHFNMFLGDISHNEFYIMTIIQKLSKQQEVITVSDIHGKLQYSMPAISQNLGVLERKAYIVRNVSKEDRRKVTVELTQTGELALQDIKHNMNENLDELIELFGKENTSELIRLLQELKRTLVELQDRSDLH